jgi:hypothetical protein
MCQRQYLFELLKGRSIGGGSDNGSVHDSNILEVDGGNRLASNII